mgnify:CR=1 FL=1
MPLCHAAAGTGTGIQLKIEKWYEKSFAFWSFYSVNFQRKIYDFTTQEIIALFVYQFKRSIEKRYIIKEVIIEKLEEAGEIEVDETAEIACEFDDEDEDEDEE